MMTLLGGSTPKLLDMSPRYCDRKSPSMLTDNCIVQGPRGPAFFGLVFWLFSTEATLVFFCLMNSLVPCLFQFLFHCSGDEVERLWSACSQTCQVFWEGFKEVLFDLGSGEHWRLLLYSSFSNTSHLARQEEFNRRLGFSPRSTIKGHT